MNRTDAEIQKALQSLYARSAEAPAMKGDAPAGAEPFRPQAEAPIGTETGAVIGPVTLLGSGFEADVFAFSLETGAQGSAGAQAAGRARDLILRLYAGQGVAEKAAHEFAAMRRLLEAGYPVPEVLLFRPRFPPSGRPALVMERIRGASLGRSYWAAPEDRRRKAQAVLSRLMADLHALDASLILPDSPLARPQGPCASVDHEVAALSALLHQLGGGEPPSLQAVLSWLVSRRSSVPCARPVVVHGDFHPNNVLVRADGASFVIDWSNVRLGDYRLDLAWSRLITQAESQEDGGLSDIHLYAELAGREVSGLDYFDVLACARLLLGVLTLLEPHASRRGSRAEAQSEAATRAGQDPSHLLYVAGLLQRRTGILMSDFERKLSVLLGL